MRTKVTVGLILACGLVGATACGGSPESKAEAVPVEEDAGADTGESGRDTGGEQLCGAPLEKAAIGINSGKSNAKVSSAESGGVWTTRVEVPWKNSSTKPYVYLRLLKGTPVPISDSKSRESDLWDMAIRGKTVRLNGGISGPGSARAAALDDTSFKSVDSETTIDSFHTDGLRSSCAPSSKADEEFETAIGEWWKSGSGSDAPTPADRLYVVERVDGTRVKLEFDSFNVDGDIATYTLRWSELGSDDSTCDADKKARETIGPVEQVSKGSVKFSSGTIEIDASAGGRRKASSRPYVYVDLDGRSKVGIDDAAAFDDDVWDLALKRVVFRVNGGDSGSGGVEVAQRQAKKIDAVSTIPNSKAFETDDFVGPKCEVTKDRIDNPVTAIGTWYKYDVNTHEIGAKNLVYVVKSTEGAPFKFHIDSYEDGRFELDYAEMSASP